MDQLGAAQALFTKQVDAYVARRYPLLAELTEIDFRDRLEPLRRAVDHAVAAGLSVRKTTGRVPFVVVVTSRLLPAEVRVPGLVPEQSTTPGSLDPGWREGELETFAPTPNLVIPERDAYLLLDVGRGDDYREITANDAVFDLGSHGRTALTLDEGVSLATVYPSTLERDAGFMLAGSRREDLRVPAIWVSAGAAKLGWGGAETPEAYLGIASAAARLAA